MLDETPKEPTKDLWLYNEKGSRLFKECTRGDIDKLKKREGWFDHPDKVPKKRIKAEKEKQEKLVSKGASNGERSSGHPRSDAKKTWYNKPAD